MTNTIARGKLRWLRLGALVLAFTLATAAEVPAQGFVSPFVGYNFGGDSGCPSLSNCEDKKINAGVAFGTMGNVVGFEEELAFAKDFFGRAPGLDSSVLTLMSNLMIVPKIGPVRPYVVGGIGLMKTHVELTLPSLLTSDNNNVAWNVGGGVIIMLGDHVGVRGDIRYLHSFQDLTVLGFTLSHTKLDFGRGSAALVLKF